MKANRTMRMLALTGAVLPMAAERTAAQPIEALTYSIEWENDVSPGNPMAKGAVWAKISPNIGTVVAWNTKPGTGQSAILRAFGSTIFDTLNTQNGTTGTLAWTVVKDFDLANVPGTPDGSGGIQGTNTGQFCNTDMKIDQKLRLLDLSWTTSDFSPRLVEFKTNATTAKVYIDNGLNPCIGENAVKVDGSGGFNVVPGPSVGLCGVAVALGLANRRRRMAPP